MSLYPRRIIAFLLIVCFVTGQTAPVFAGPQGGTVVAGGATIRQESPTKTGITQATDRVAIDWRSFSIGANEHVQFYQPSANSVALNRVVGVDPSVILGRLTANGRVFLVNPNGIVFGQGSQVDVSGLMASTHNIRNQDFMAGRNVFDIPGKPGASVINQGTIRIADTGIAAFVAPSVANHGIIAARLGKVALVAANGFTLDLYGDRLVNFLVNEEVASQAFDLSGKPLGSLVENSGRIEAQGGYVLLSAQAAQNLVKSVINQSGVIAATSAGVQNGEIILSGGAHGEVRNSGTLDASGRQAGERGGRVTVTGESAKLTGTSMVNVSGDVGGGTVLIGGDHMGGKGDPAMLERYGLAMEKTAVPTAKSVRVESGAVIKADALGQGKGGKVVVWGDDSADFSGTVSAKGGPRGGDGGVVEISAGNRVSTSGAKVDVSAPKGRKGVYFIDPGGAGYSSPQDFLHYLYVGDYMDELLELAKDPALRGMFIQAMQVVGDTTYVLTSRIYNAVTRIGPALEQNYPHEVFLTKIDGSGNISQVRLGGLQYFPIAGYLGSHVGAIYVTGGNVKVFCSSMDLDGSGMTGGLYSFSASDLSAIGGVTATFRGSTTEGYMPYFWNDGATVRSSSYDSAWQSATGIPFSKLQLMQTGLTSAQADALIASRPAGREWWDLYSMMADQYERIHGNRDNQNADDYADNTKSGDYLSRLQPTIGDPQVYDSNSPLPQEQTGHGDFPQPTFSAPLPHKRVPNLGGLRTGYEQRIPTMSAREKRILRSIFNDYFPPGARVDIRLLSYTELVSLTQRLKARNLHLGILGLDTGKSMLDAFNDWQRSIDVEMVAVERSNAMDAVQWFDVGVNVFKNAAEASATLLSGAGAITKSLGKFSKITAAVKKLKLAELGPETKDFVELLGEFARVSALAAKITENNFSALTVQDKDHINAALAQDAGWAVGAYITEAAMERVQEKLYASAAGKLAEAFTKLAAAAVLEGDLSKLDGIAFELIDTIPVFGNFWNTAKECYSIASRSTPEQARVWGNFVKANNEGLQYYKRAVKGAWEKQAQTLANVAYGG